MTNLCLMYLSNGFIPFHCTLLRTHLYISLSSYHKAASVFSGQHDIWQLESLKWIHIHLLHSLAFKHSQNNSFSTITPLHRELSVQ